MNLLITNIHKLYGVATTNFLNEVKIIENGWILCENDIIKDFGQMQNLPEMNADKTIDATNRLVLPAWVDAHTHLVFAASREEEFVQRINGLTYEEIAKKGGGILNSAQKMKDIDEQELYEKSFERLQQVIAQGTGAIEIKSGYGLSLEAEMKMLRVIRKLKENTKIPIKASFLAAHAYPLEYKQNHEGYLNLIINEMLPKIVMEGLADYMDVFCEEGFFNINETERLLNAGVKWGLKPKIHANQLHNIGAVQLGVKYNAVSVDHLECIEAAEINALLNSTTIPTLLPAAAYFLCIPYQPARKMIDAGLQNICLATDYNPGSCPSGNVNLLLSIACTQLKMTPEEAFNAVTINGAKALEMQDILGTIEKGKKSQLIITKPMNSIAYIPYDFGNNPIQSMIIDGKTF